MHDGCRCPATLHRGVAYPNLLVTTEVTCVDWWAVVKQAVLLKLDLFSVRHIRWLIMHASRQVVIGGCVSRGDVCLFRLLLWA